MPTAASRKCEFYIDKLCFGGDVKFYPIVLTADQVAKYNLPRIPIKETERRAARFEDQHGAGAVELDALEAIYPGELASIVRKEILRYYDPTLSWRIYDAKSLLRNELEDIQTDVYSEYDAQIKAIEDEYSQIAAEFTQRLTGINERVSAVWQAISDDLDAKMPDVNDYDVPEPLLADEKPSALYDSKRGYLEQIACYKAFQGKDAPEVTNE